MNQELLTKIDRIQRDCTVQGWHSEHKEAESININTIILAKQVARILDDDWNVFAVPNGTIVFENGDKAIEISAGE